jgi:acyl-CoA reductase-like NAD-dependent aldehyde dehydrogenase
MHRFTVNPHIVSLIDGQDVGRDGKTIPVIYPGDGKQVSVLHEADAHAVDAAVKAAHRAFASWSKTSVEERQRYMHAIADALEKHADELAYLECLNAGLVMREVRARHLVRAAGNFRFFAEFISQDLGKTVTQNPLYQTTVTRSAAGVCALIAPWNAPLALASMKVASAIAFGNTCVLKPSEYTPLSMRRMVEIFHEAGLPNGVVNLVNGSGAVTGQSLTDHALVRRISFTGGTETGRHIMAAGARRLCPVGLELGGKSANIIFASADYERALDGALLSIYSNNGQQCLAGSRIMVEKKIADKFIADFTARAKKIRIGDPMAADTELGPLAFEAHMNRVLSFAEVAREDGCEILTGGKRAAGFGNGFYLEPTAVLAKDNKVRCAQQEIFGPFATFQIFNDFDDAITRANDSDFGLVAYVWSDDLHTVMRAQQQLDAGTIWVNTPLMRELRAPFGGTKQSGIGRDGGYSCAEFFSEEKTVSIPYAPLALHKLGA